MPFPPVSGFAASDYSGGILDVSSSAIIIKPIREDGIDVFFFFLPGALTAPQYYLPLVNEVQAQCSLRLWVAILDPVYAPFPFTAMIKASFDGVLERVKELGFPVGVPPSKNVLFCGHSMGSWEARSPALSRAEAFIQLGSCFHTSPDNLVQYARPVLTLSGSRDGQITNATIAKHAGEILAQQGELGDYFVHVVKPVILIPGMNHAQFSHGIPNKGRGDLDAEISNEHARQVASRLIASFMMAHISKEAEVTASAIAALREAVAQTQKQYKVFWEAIEDPGRDAKKMQLKLDAFPGSHVGLVHHDFRNNFEYSKPWIDSQSESKRFIVQAFFHPLGTFAVLSNMWVKFKSSEGAADQFALRGARFNEKTFKEALALVPEDVRRNYAKQGRKLQFVEDKVVESDEEWIASDVSITELAEVQSTAMSTPSNYYVKRSKSLQLDLSGWLSLVIRPKNIIFSFMKGATLYRPKQVYCNFHIHSLKLNA